MRVSLQNRNIPRDPMGVPRFHYLKPENTPANKTAVLDVFTEEEVVELVNRSIYQIEYQAFSHKKKQQLTRDLEFPIKLALKKVHPGIPWSKATPQQVADAVEYYKAHPEGKENA